MDNGTTRVAHYIKMRDTMPMKSLGDSIHGIHFGTEWEATLSLSDLREMVATTQHLTAERDAATKDSNEADIFAAKLMNAIFDHTGVLPEGDAEYTTGDLEEMLAEHNREFDRCDENMRIAQRERDAALELARLMAEAWTIIEAWPGVSLQLIWARIAIADAHRVLRREIIQAEVTIRGY